MVDRNGDGNIDVTELLGALDKDGDGMLTYNEFVDQVVDLAKASTGLVDVPMSTRDTKERPLSIRASSVMNDDIRRKQIMLNQKRQQLEKERRAQEARQARKRPSLQAGVLLDSSGN